MKRLRILGLCLLALFALSAIAATVALAGEEGVLEPTTFKIKGGAQTRSDLSGASITCTAVTGEGTPLKEKDKDTHSTGKLDFTGCTTGGLSLNSLGDAAKTILMNVLFLLCLLGVSTGLDWGVLVEPTEDVHIEVPLFKKLIIVLGSIIGELLTKLAGTLLINEPNGKVFGVTFLQEDVATRTKCHLTELGEWTATYAAADDTEKEIDAWQEGEWDIEFAKEVKFMDK